MARRRGDELPPISVYRVHGRHYVIDGHHRVSVECSLDAAHIDADVVELLPLAAAPHTRSAPPSPPSPARRARWSHGEWPALILFLAGALALALLSGIFGPVAGYVLIIAACALIGHGLGIPLHTGLKHYRQ